MKRLKNIVAGLVALCIMLSGMRAFALSENSIHTSAKTPISSETAALKWQKSFGSSYANAPSIPTVVDDTVLVMSGNTLYKLDSKDGNIIQSVEMAEKPNYGYTPVTYADGVIYCPLNNGTIQAFRYKTMQSLWIYRDPLGGQSLTPITYSDGCVYTGFWNDEDEYANYVCINVKDANKFRSDEEKTAVWRFPKLGGFYWAGCAVFGDKIVFGGDDGTVYSDRTAHLYCLEKNSGKTIDTVSVTGDQRSTVVYHAGRVYAATKAGWLYSIAVDANGIFNDSSIKKLYLGGATTATPVIYNNRLYVGVQGSGFGSGSLKVIDASSLKLIDSVAIKGYPQNAALVSDGYYAENGNVYIYLTYNAAPGGITVITDRAGQTSPVKEELFTPNSDSRNYGISTISADSNGTLYYRNDSGNIFAIENTENRQEENASWLVRFFRTIVEFFKNLFS